MKKITIPILLILITLLSGCNIKSIKIRSPIENVALTFSDTKIASSTETSVVKYATLTITPSDGYYKTISWTAEWDANAINKDRKVSEFITVTPLEDNKIGEITCLQPFGSDIIYIKAKPNTTELTATITLTFKGLPYGINIININPPELIQDITKSDKSESGIFLNNFNLYERNFKLLPLFPFGIQNDNYNAQYEIVDVYMKKSPLFRLGHYDETKKRRVYSGTGIIGDPVMTSRLGLIKTNNYLSDRKQTQDNFYYYFPLKDFIKVEIYNNILTIQRLINTYDNINADDFYLNWYYDIEHDPYNIDKFYCIDQITSDMCYIKIREKQSKTEKIITYNTAYGSL